MNVRPIILAWLTIGACLCASAAPLSAQSADEISLPLQGYFRPGRYMPVHASAPATLGGEGIVPTEVRARGPAVVPVLVVAPTARELAFGSTTRSLRAVAEEDLLVGVVGDYALDLSNLFPGKRALPIRLDPQMLRSTPPIVWDALDVLELDVWPGPIDPVQVNEWLATGVTIVVSGSSEASPDERWPWEKRKGLWLLRAELLGPSQSIVGEPGYLAALGWTPGASAPLRRHIVLAGVLFGIAALASLLLRGSGGVVMLVLVTTGAIVIIAAWMRSHSSLRQISGQILVDPARHVAAQPRDSSASQQWDQWTYFTSRSTTPTPGTMPLYALTRPILYDPRQIETANLRLHWDDDGQRWMSFELRDNVKLAFLSRQVTAPSSQTLAPVAPDHPLVPLARRLYLRDEWRISGQIDPIDDSAWAPIALQR